MSAEEPETEAGAANDATEVVYDDFSTHLRNLAGSRADTQFGEAWSDEDDAADDAESESHPWSVVTGHAAALVSAGAAVAVITGMVGLLWLHNDRPAPSPAPEKSTSSAAAPAPPPPSTVTVTATTQTSTHTSTPVAATRPTTGSPCTSHDYAKLAIDGNGQEIFCHSDPMSPGRWELTPSDVTGVYMIGTACEGVQKGDKIPLARSIDGYLITCEPASWAGPPGGSGLMWQRYRGMFDPGV